jgi:signal peptidase I
VTASSSDSNSGEPAPWLESVDLVGERRTFPGRRLRYHPVVHVQDLKLRLGLRPGMAQQLVLEHRTAERLISADIVSVEANRVEWPVQLARGWNRLRCAAPGETSKVFVLDVTHKSELREWLETLLYALAFALLIRTFLVQVFVLPLDSPMGGLKTGDRVLVNRLHYLLASPSAGDLAIFEHSPGGPARFVIRHVAATPGQNIEAHGSGLQVDGLPIGPPFDQLKTLGVSEAELPADISPTRVPEGSAFLASSTRDAGGHAGVWWGFLEDRALLGRAWAIFWPWERRGWLD